MLAEVITIRLLFNTILKLLDAGDFFAQAIHGAAGQMAPQAVVALAAD